MSLSSFLKRHLRRLLGLSPIVAAAEAPEVLPPGSVPPAHELEVRATFARAALDVWLVENENRPGEKFVKVADCDGFGHALRACAAYAREHRRTTEFVIFNDVGLRLCKVLAEVHYDAVIIHVVEWICPALLRMHQLHQARQRAEMDAAA